jgi:hypothetical protein
MNTSIQFFHTIPNRVQVKMIKTGEVFSSEDTWKESFRKDPVTAEVLQVALSRGPFVAFAKVGPNFYTDQPVKFTHQIPHHPGFPIHGWRPDAKRNLDGGVQGIYESVIVCGVQEREGIKHVYYVRAKEIRTDWKEGLGTYDILPTDRKVYASSVHRFSNTLMEMYPPALNAKIEQRIASATTRDLDLQAKIACLRKQLEAEIPTVPVFDEETGTNT